jgi:hypothetical protein
VSRAQKRAGPHERRLHSHRLRLAGSQTQPRQRGEKERPDRHEDRETLPALVARSLVVQMYVEMELHHLLRRRSTSK